MVELIVTELGLGRKSSSSITSTNIGKNCLHLSSSMRKFEIFPASVSQRELVFLLKSTKRYSHIQFCFLDYLKTPKNMELFGTFSYMGGTELKWNGTSYFFKIGTCNGTSYYFKPLERNLTSYIWNGTIDTTGFSLPWKEALFVDGAGVEPRAHQVLSPCCLYLSTLPLDLGCCAAM